MCWFFVVVIFVAKNRFRNSKVHFVHNKISKIYVMNSLRMVISELATWHQFESDDLSFILKYKKAGLKNVNKIAWKWNATMAKNNFYVHSDSYATDVKRWIFDELNVYVILVPHVVRYALAQRMKFVNGKEIYKLRNMNWTTTYFCDDRLAIYLSIQFAINPCRNAMNLTLFFPFFNFIHLHPNGYFHFHRKSIWMTWNTENSGRMREREKKDERNT